MTARTPSKLLVVAAVGSCTTLAATLTHYYIRRDRWALIRKHPWRCVRQVYKYLYVYQFAWKLDRAALSIPKDDVEAHPGAHALLDAILKAGPDTFQKKPTNRTQIESLVGCVCQLVQDERATRTMVLDMGAGKALFTRAVYEALDRKVACTALDSRAPHKKDQFYDPVDVVDADAKYSRVVADVHRLSSKRTVDTIMKEQQQNSVVVVTKHLCGGATDSSIVSTCTSPMRNYIDACVLAPCCHQKIKKGHQYCNLPYLQSLGFCETQHVGLRGEILDADFRTLGMLVSVSKMTQDQVQDFEYKNKHMMHLLGFQRMKELGRKARRVLEEGRMRYLREKGGFQQVKLVRYCEESITGDNLAIIATKGF